VENTVIIELKAAEVLLNEHETQLLNYLSGTDIEVGLLFNFGIKAAFELKVFNNELKVNLKNK
jgi:GxxExxY protein